MAYLSIDPKLLDLALKISGERTKAAAVTKALEEFIARRQQRCVLDLMGKFDWTEPKCHARQPNVR